MSNQGQRPQHREYVLTAAGYAVLAMDEASVVGSVRHQRARAGYVLTDAGRAALAVDDVDSSAS